MRGSERSEFPERLLPQQPERLRRQMLSGGIVLLRRQLLPGALPLLRSQLLRARRSLLRRFVLQLAAAAGNVSAPTAGGQLPCRKRPLRLSGQ